MTTLTASVGRRTLRLAAVSTIGLALVAGGAATAQAKGGGGDVRTRGACSASSDWKLKAKHDDAKIQVEFEVESNVPGQTWSVRLADNGMTTFSGTQTTGPRSGSFSLETRIADLPGNDTISASATNPATGETCSGSLTLR